MAHGLGVLGLRLSDLEQLTPDEFAAVCDAHHEQAEAALADHWTRARLMTTLSLQPHTTRRLTPEQLLPLPWDAPRPRPEAPQLTPQAQRERAHQLAARLAAQTAPTADPSVHPLKP